MLTTARSPLPFDGAIIAHCQRSQRRVARPEVRTISSHRISVLAILILVLSACSAAQAPALPSAAQSARMAPKRIVAGISGEPRTAYATFGQAGVRGADALNALINAGFSTLDGAGTLQPLLAEAVPSIENGLWRVLDDGGMETTWRIREGARWHDGVAVTPDDIAFTVQVLRDREIPFPAEFASQSAGVREIAEVSAPDARTVVVRWQSLYINADRVFGVVAAPLPKHLLEASYIGAKASFSDLPYWRDGFVGNGPFKVKDWTPGTSVVLAASDVYALGRPPIDEIDLRFVLDANALLAYVLGGEVDITLGRSFSPEQAILVRSQWQTGRVDTGGNASALNIWPQFRDSNPAVISDLRFRRALYQSLDRQTMADTLEGGLVGPAESWLVPSWPEYPAIQHYIARYSYDPRAALQAIEGLGYVRGADGAFRDGSDQPLRMELRSITLPDINARTLLVVRDQWQQVGVTVDSYIVPPQDTDPALTRNFPGFLILRIPADVLIRANEMHSRTPPRGGYVNPEMDALVERFEVTIARQARMDIAGQIVRHMTEQLTIMPLFYDPGIGFVANRLLNVPAMGDAPPWNAHEWDLRG
jgi:peptide/nickel transport system substrate-binding protein